LIGAGSICFSNGTRHDQFFFLSSYSHLLPNDDEAFEHFDSFISRRIDEVGIPYKFVIGQGE
jgi:hypothetical protein